MSVVPKIQVLRGDCRDELKKLPDKSVHCVVTSPPFWALRSYLPADHPQKHLEIGQEKTPLEYIETLVAVFREIHRVLRDDGTVWLNLGDTFAGGGNGGGGSFATTGIRDPIDGTDKNVPSRKGTRGVTVKSKRIARGSGRWGGGNVGAGPDLKAKDLVGIPWRVALALQADGWYLRSDIIWAKPNPMPESVTDRPTRSHEYVFLLTKSRRYYYDAEAIKERCVYYDARIDDPNFIPQRKERDQVGAPSRGGGPLNKRADKKRGHSRRHEGLSDRWDAMEKTDQCAGMRNKRDVWRHEAEFVLFQWMEQNAPELFQRFLNEAKNRIDVFDVSPAQYREAHFATFPEDLIRPCILAGCPQGGVVLDPFVGSGTTGRVSLENGRNAIVIELNSNYLPFIEDRTHITPGLPIG